MSTQEYTKLSDVIDPQVIAEGIQEELQKKSIFTGIATVKDDLKNVPGTTVTMGSVKEVSMAQRLTAGQEKDVENLVYETTQVKVYKAGKAVGFDDFADVASVDDLYNSAIKRISNSVSSRIENDLIEAALYGTKYVETGLPVDKADATVITIEEDEVLNWSAFVRAAKTFGEAGVSNLKGVVVTANGWGELALDPVRLVDTGVARGAVYDAKTMNIGGAPVYLSATLDGFNTPAGDEILAVLVNEGALSLYWKTMPHFSQLGANLADLTTLQASTFYATHRANKSGVVVIKRAAATTTP